MIARRVFEDLLRCARRSFRDTMIRTATKTISRILGSAWISWTLVFPRPWSWSRLDPVGRAVAGAHEMVGLYEGLQQHRSVAVRLMRRRCSSLGAGALRWANDPADEAVARSRLIGAEVDDRQHVPLAADQVAAPRSQQRRIAGGSGSGPQTRATGALHADRSSVVPAVPAAHRRGRLSWRNSGSACGARRRGRGAVVAPLLRPGGSWIRVRAASPPVSSSASVGRKGVAGRAVRTFAPHPRKGNRMSGRRLGGGGTDQPRRLHVECPSAVTHLLRRNGFDCLARRATRQHARFVAVPGRGPLVVLGHRSAGYGTGVPVLGLPCPRVDPQPFHRLQRAEPYRVRLTAPLRPQAVSSSCAQPTGTAARSACWLSSGRTGFTTSRVSPNRRHLSPASRSRLGYVRRRHRADRRLRRAQPRSADRRLAERRDAAAPVRHLRLSPLAPTTTPTTSFSSTRTALFNPLCLPALPQLDVRLPAMRTPTS